MSKKGRTGMGEKKYGQEKREAPTRKGGKKGRNI